MNPSKKQRFAAQMLNRNGMREWITMQEIKCGLLPVDRDRVAALGADMETGTVVMVRTTGNLSRPERFRHQQEETEGTEFLRAC
jgi:hypothetical protein